MKKLFNYLLLLGALALIGCDNTPTTLTVINACPDDFDMDSTGAIVGIHTYAAVVYYGAENILTVSPHRIIKRKLDKNMMNRPVKHLQVDMLDLENNKLYSLHYNEKVKFVSNMTYVLTIDEKGGTLTTEPIEIAQ